jgi:hypothetical protein
VIATAIRHTSCQATLSISGAIMNAVEIEEAVSDLSLRPFDAIEFPFAFLAAFDNKETTIC